MQARTRASKKPHGDSEGLVLPPLGGASAGSHSSYSSAPYAPSASFGASGCLAIIKKPDSIPSAASAVGGASRHGWESNLWTRKRLAVAAESYESPVKASAIPVIHKPDKTKQLIMESIMGNLLFLV